MLQAGHKRIRYIDMTAQSALPEAATAVAAAAAPQQAAASHSKDGESAKQALENEFECTICRVRISVFKTVSCTTA